MANADMQTQTRNKRRMLTVLTVGAILVLAFALAACQPNSVTGDQASSKQAGDLSEKAISTASYTSAAEAYQNAVPHPSGTCVECHTDLDELQTAAAGSEVDAQLYLVDEDFPTSTHGMLGCTYCHGGHSDTADPALAMKDMNPYPTKDGGNAVCGTCHGEIVANFQTSLHYTAAGLEKAWNERLEQANVAAGANLAELYYHEGDYQGACVDCHADCSECHIRNADAAMFGIQFNGFVDGHNFSSQTSNDEIANTCLSCHAGAIAACYTEADVHGPSGADMNCMDCHKESDIHGDGVERNTMVHSGAVQTECEECHELSQLSGEWHSTVHEEGVECWACHSTSYRTCYSCHGWNAAERDDVPWNEENKVILGYDLDNGKVTTLVKAPIDAGMLRDAVNFDMDADSLANRSTWWAGFTHGVIKPMVDQAFCNRCHGEGTDLLTADELQYPEYEKAHLITGLPEVNVGDYQ